MAPASPNPMNLMLLAGLGIGAYWFMTRRAQAAPVAVAPAGGGQAPSQGLANANALVNLVGSVSKLFGGAQNLLGTYDGRAASPWDVSPNGTAGPTYNNPSAYVSSALDGLAFNPPVGGAYDAVAYALDGSNGAYWN